MDKLHYKTRHTHKRNKQEVTDTSPLGLLSAGKKVEIVEVRAQKDCCHGKIKHEFCRAEDMGIRVGKVVEMLKNDGKGLILLKADESRIAIGRGMAMEIMVKEVNSPGEHLHLYAKKGGF